MNIMATQITGKKFPQFHHTEKGTLLLWDLAYRDNLVLLHVKTVDIHVILPICLRQVAYFIIWKSPFIELHVHHVSSSEKLYSFVLNFCMFEIGFFNTNTVRIFNNL